MFSKDLVSTNEKGIHRLNDDAIAQIQIKYTRSTRYIQDYKEQPSSYVIKLKGENIWRRVYITQIGNPSVMYLKTKYYRHIFCETAVDQALNNV